MVEVDGLFHMDAEQWWAEHWWEWESNPALSIGSATFDQFYNPCYSDPYHDSQRRRSLNRATSVCQRALGNS